MLNISKIWQCCKRFRTLVLGSLIGLSGAGWFPHSALASEALVYHATLESAYAAAEKQNTLVLLFFRADWCMFSKAFEQKTLSSSQVITGVPPLQVYRADVEQHRQLAEEYRVNFLPYLVLLNPEGKIIDQDKGVPAPDEFIVWIQNGIKKELQGEWSGYSPSGKLGRFLEIFRSGKPREKDYRQLVAMLGAEQPADRILAAQIVLDLGAPVIPYLIKAAGGDYLGLRVGAVNMLARMIPAAPQVDPWAPQVDRKTAVTRLASWWETRKRDVFVKTPASTAEALNHLKEFNAAIPYDRQAIQNALKGLRTRDAVKRTAAMTYLVEQGPQTLPMLRTHLKEAEDRNDHELVRQLNDVRWAILVSPQIVSHLPSIRMVLSRGTIHQRINLVEQLIALGDTCLPVLAELVHDGDPLIQEAALQGLASIHSRTAVAQMATLLESDNPNLRMVTAQMLGRTGNRLAASYLEKALDDVDEVVVVTALAALEELQAKDAAEAVIRKMKDGRWRVRATAAKIAGELGLAMAESHLRQLLNDRDPFVVKSALDALLELKTPLTVENVESVTTQHIDLLPELTRQIHLQASEQLITSLTTVFVNTSIDHQRRILETLTGLEARESSTPFIWRPFFETALNSSSSDIRRLAIRALGAGSPELHLELLPAKITTTSPASEDADAIWSDALALLCHHYGYRKPYKSGDHCLMCSQDEEEADEILEMKDQAKATDPQKEKRRAVLTARYNEWRQLLNQDPQREKDLTRTLLHFYLSSGASPPANLSAVMTVKTLSTFQERSYGSYCLKMLLERVDKGRDLAWLEEMTASPEKYRCLVLHADKASEAVQDFLRSPKRLGPLLEKLDIAETGDIIQAMVRKEETILSLRNKPEWGRRMCTRLKTSQASHLRMLGLLAAGFNEEPDGNLAAARPLLRATDPWLRKAAVAIVTRQEPSLKRREKILAPLIADPHARVATAAVCGLLADTTRRKGSLGSLLEYFEYDSLRIYMPTDRTSYHQEDQRPLSPLKRRPDFLPALWRYYLNRSSAAGKEAVAAAMLLMAQYGDFRAIEHYLKHTPPQDLVLTDALLAAIQLSRNPAHLDSLRIKARQTPSSYRLAEILDAVRTTKGPEVRRFRREINQLCRQLQRQE